MARPAERRDDLGRHLMSDRGCDPPPWPETALNLPGPQAPQRRSTPTDPAKTERQRRIYLVRLGLVASPIVPGVFLGGGGGGGGRAAVEDAGYRCELWPCQLTDHSGVCPLAAKPK